MNLGIFIKQKRKEKNLTLKQVATMIGVSEMTVSRWERNEIKNMKSDKIALLANILGIPVMSLFDGWDENGNKIEFETITSTQFKNEVQSLLSKCEDLSDQERMIIKSVISTIDEKK